MQTTRGKHILSESSLKQSEKYLIVVTKRGIPLKKSSILEGFLIHDKQTIEDYRKNTTRVPLLTSKKVYTLNILYILNAFIQVFVAYSSVILSSKDRNVLKTFSKKPYFFLLSHYINTLISSNKNKFYLGLFYGR